MAVAVFYKTQSGQITRFAFSGRDVSENPFKQHRTTEGESLLVIEDSELPSDYRQQKYKVVAGTLVLDEGALSLSDAKERKAQEIKQTAWQLLAPTDWYVIRHYETEQPIPEDVLVYREAIRTISDMAEDAINQATTVEEVRDYEPEWPEPID